MCLKHRIVDFAKRIAMLIVFCGLVLAQNNLNSQRQIQSSEIGTYGQVLNILFPNEAKSNVFGYRFVFRYCPSLAPESQITIENELGTVRVVEYEAESNISDQIDRFESEDPFEIARSIRIKVRKVEVRPEQLKKWRESFYKKLAKSLDQEKRIIKENMRETFHADDGTKYSLWYGGVSQIFYEYRGGSSVESGANSEESEIVGFMKEVKKFVANSKSL